MSTSQPDLFTAPDPAAVAPDAEVLAILGRRLHATLALVKAAETMPWTDMLAVVREDNAFRHATRMLPAEEGAGLWAAFDVEMGRLYAIMNEGRDHPASCSASDG